MSKKKIELLFTSSFDSASLKSVSDKIKTAIDTSSADKKMIEDAQTFLEKILDASKEIDKLQKKGMLNPKDVKDLDTYTKKLEDSFEGINKIFDQSGAKKVPAMENLRSELQAISVDAKNRADEIKKEFGQKMINKGFRELQGVKYKDALNKAGLLEASAKDRDVSSQRNLDLANASKDQEAIRKATEERAKALEIGKRELEQAAALRDVHKGTTATLTRSSNAYARKAKVVKDNAEASQDLANKQKELEKSNLKAIIDAQRNAVDALRSSTGTTRDEMTRLQAVQQTYGDTLSQVGNKIKQVTSFLFIMRKAFQAIQKSATVVAELDREMVEIGIVSKQTTDELWKSFGTFNDLAKELATTTRQYLEGAKIFFQQGYEMAEVISLVDATTKAAVLSSTDFKTASEALTAAIRAFNLTAEDATSITDKYAAVGAYSAADFQELSTAMEKVASSAYSAGMSFDSTLGILAKGIETTKEAPEAYLNRRCFLKSVA